MKLNQKIELHLVQNPGTVFSYKQIAEVFQTGCRAVGSAMKAIGKRNSEICNRVVFSRELK